METYEPVAPRAKSKDDKPPSNLVAWLTFYGTIFAGIVKIVVAVVSLKH